jgi:hypothetical protein
MRAVGRPLEAGMALNTDKVGTTYPAYAYEVSREKIREYAVALGETDPRYLSDGDDCLAPPTFAACFTVMRGSTDIFADPDLGTHHKLVHGSHAFRFGDRPLRPGDRLVCTPQITDISARGSNEMMTIQIACRFDDTDEHAVTSEAVIVFLGSAPADEASGRDGQAAASKEAS